MKQFMADCESRITHICQVFCVRLVTMDSLIWGDTIKSSNINVVVFIILTIEELSIAYLPLVNMLTC